MRGVAPSILSADFARLGEQVEAVVDAGARIVHVDVMDGHFVPPITIGPLVVEALRARTDAFLDVHLMIEAPERQIDAFAKAGASNITVHVEATVHLHRTLQAIKEAGCHAGVAICPATPVESIAEVAGLVDVALCMTVNPGWGGQPFIASSLKRIERLAALLPEGVAIEVDGGIDKDTAGPCAAAGANVFVAGSAIFGSDDPGAAYRQISAAAGCG